VIVENFGAAFQARRIVVAGGATHSPLWLQIHADTIGAPLELTEVPDAPALGCAILAARGAERFSTIEEGAKAMVRTTIAPNEANASRYDAFYPQYLELYAALKKVREAR
jgi:sugar (pentulose or hexulose) kinase